MNFADLNNNEPVVPPSLEIPQPLVPPPLPLVFPKDEDVFKEEESVPPPINEEVIYCEVVEEDDSNKIKIDSSKVMKHNCYDKDKKNILFKMLAEAYIFLWLSNDGEFFYRIGNDGTIIKVTASKLRMILKNKLRFDISIDDNSADDQSKNLNTVHLHLVSADTFEPNSREEFFEKKYETYRNLFRTTTFMTFDKNQKYQEPTTIFAYLKSLVNNIDERFIYFLNWLGYFLQFLKRPMTAIVFKGKPGTGKNLFAEQILNPIFGEEQVAIIGDKALRTNFAGSMFENKMFYVFDEISQSAKDNNQLQNFLKEIVTNPSVKIEKKFANLSKSTVLHGPCLFFSNKAVPIAIEPNDRRYSVCSTGKTLIETDFHGHGSYEKFIPAIKEELPDLVLYLLNMEIDKKLANTVMNTPEKEALVAVTNNRYVTFHEALINKKYEYFESLESSPIAGLWIKFKKDLEDNKISRKFLSRYILSTTGEEISTAKLLGILRTIDSTLYHIDNTIGSDDGDRFFLLEGHKKSLLNNDEKEIDSSTTIPLPSDENFEII